MPAVVNTELGSGLRETRAIKKLEPEDVAEAIVAALERPKFDVWVPRESVGIYKLDDADAARRRARPRPPAQGRQGARRGTTQAVRAAYEDRAAHSDRARGRAAEARGEESTKSS